MTHFLLDYWKMIMHIKVFCESATIKDYDDILENVKQLSFPKTSHLKK